MTNTPSSEDINYSLSLVLLQKILACCPFHFSVRRGPGEWMTQGLMQILWARQQSLLYFAVI